MCWVQLKAKVSFIIGDVKDPRFLDNLFVKYNKFELLSTARPLKKVFIAILIDAFLNTFLMKTKKTPIKRDINAYESSFVFVLITISVTYVLIFSVFVFGVLFITALLTIRLISGFCLRFGWLFLVALCLFSWLFLFFLFWYFVKFYDL